MLSLHFFYAQRFEDAWRFSRVAAERAAAIYANVEARDFYVRAIESARRLRDVDPVASAGAEEALGDVRMRLGEYRGAESAYRGSRRRLEGHPLAEARLLLKEALVSDVEGRFPQALRTLTKGTNLLVGLANEDAAGVRAQLAANYGGIRWAQGRNEDAIRWCRTALEEGERAGELDAVAHALYVLDISEHSLGVSQGGPYSKQALELYEQLGNLAKQGDVLSNLGYYAYFQGDWNEAREWYERARDVFLRTGNVVDAAIDDGNIGEILVYQGRLDEAEALLRETLRVFKASGVRAVEVFVTTLLAATASRSGRFEEATAIFGQVEALSREVGDASRSVDVAGLRAESLVLQDRPRDAIEVIDEVLRSLPATHPHMPWLLRTRGYALAELHEPQAASEALERSIAAARVLGATHDVAFALEAFLRCGLTDGRSAGEIRSERDELFSRLGIVGVPDVPLPAPN